MRTFHSRKGSRDSDSEVAEDSRPVSLRRLLALARPEWKRLSVATVFLLIGSGAGLAYPQAIRVLIDATLSEGRVTIDRAAVALALIFLVQSVAVGLRYWLFTISGERIVTRLREAVYRSIVAQEIGFFDQRRTGELTNRLSADTTVVQNAVSVNLSMVLRSAVTAVGGLALLLVSSPKLTVVMVVLIPPVMIAAVVVGRRVSKLSKKAQDALARAGEVAEESIAGIRTVRSFAREEAESERYADAVWHAFSISRRRVGVVALFFSTMTLAAFGAVAAVLWFGSRLVVDGEISIGELTSFMLYTLIVAMAISALAELWTDFVRARGASQRIFELMDRSPDMDPGEGRRPEHVEGRVHFDGVSFAYPSRADIGVLCEVDVSLAPGEVVALVGPSGAGKSTVASLLLRLYDPTSGSVKVDGLDLRSLDASWLRNRIGVVAQEPVLFSTSIAANIRYGCQEASDEDLEDAARAANAHGFICDFPEGYETEVGERGVQLSGGQKQRVAIARALLKNPPILVLDEATSALDAESEALVREALERLMAQRTSLVIAHRLSTVKSADRVVVLESGRVIEEGTHDQLIAADGLYRRLVRHQLV